MAIKLYQIIKYLTIDLNTPMNQLMI